MTPVLFRQTGTESRLGSERGCSWCSAHAPPCTHYFHAQGPSGCQLPACNLGLCPRAFSGSWNLLSYLSRGSEYASLITQRSLVATNSSWLTGWGYPECSLPCSQSPPVIFCAKWLIAHSVLATFLPPFSAPSSCWYFLGQILILRSASGEPDIRPVSMETVGLVVRQVTT